MAFSIFGKKDSAPAKPAAAPAGKPAPAKSAKHASPGEAAVNGTAVPGRAGPPAPKPAALAPDGLSSKINEIEAEMDDLDFSALAKPPVSAGPLPPSDLPATVDAALPPAEAHARQTPAPAVAPARPLTPQPEQAAAAPVHTPALQAAKPEPRAAAPAIAQKSAPRSAPRADPDLTALGVSSVLMRELALSPFESAPVLEQAALLHAEGKSTEARTALEAALKQGRMEQAAAHQAWLLLFDTLEILGAAAAFEAAAIDFAVAFETSPPAFTDRSGATAVDPMLETGGGQYYAINGALDASVAPQLDRLATIAQSGAVMRIEFRKIQSVAEAGCALLLERLRAFRKAGIEPVFSNTSHLTGLLEAAIEPERRSDPEVFWLLLLELYQFEGRQDIFEEAALNYCITYEVSPPQWEAPARPVPLASATAAPQAAAEQRDAIYLKGTLQGGGDPRIAAINDYAASRKLVVIDMFDLRRVDPPAASEFINVLSALYVQGRELELRSPSPLIATLLISMGFTEQARFTQRAA